MLRQSKNFVSLQLVLGEGSVTVAVSSLLLPLFSATAQRWAGASPLTFSFFTVPLRSNLPSGVCTSLPAGLPTRDVQHLVERHHQSNRHDSLVLNVREGASRRLESCVLCDGDHGQQPSSTRSAGQRFDGSSF